MNKTFLKLDKEISMIVLSMVTILFSFISGYSPVNNVISFLLVLVKSIIFIFIPLAVYILEKEQMEFKKLGGIYASYFIINLFVSVVASVSFVDGVVVSFWAILFDFVNLIILLSGLFILIDNVLEYAQIKNKVYSNTVMKTVYLVANFVSYPFLMFINKKINKDCDEE